MIEHDLFMRYWNGPYRAQLDARVLPYSAAGELAWMMTRPDSHVITTDMTDDLRRECPWLERVLSNGRQVLHHAIYLGASGAKVLYEQDDKPPGFEGITMSEVEPDGSVLVGEFMESVQGDDYSGGDIDPHDFQSLSQALDRVARDTGISKLLNSGVPITSLMSDGMGGHTVSEVFGQKAIDQRVDEFREQMENSSWFGGGDES